jgi:hypothetical protein
MRQRLLNFWSIMKFHHILEHKARFYGVPVILVDPQNTSRACPVCGRVVDRLRGHVLACPCGARMGRHEAAAVNIARRGMEFLEGLDPRGRSRWATPRGRSSGLGIKPRATTGIRGQLRKSYYYDRGQRAARPDLATWPDLGEDEIEDELARFGLRYMVEQIDP